MAVKLVIDTCADLTEKDLDSSVSILPIPVYIDGKEYIPFKNLSPEEFYPLQKQAKTSARTSQVPFQLLYTTFKEAVKEGKEVVGLFMGSAHSGTFSSALLAKEQVKEELGSEAENKIFLVDSQNVTYPYAALAFEGFKMMKQGVSGRNIADRLAYLVPRIHMRAFIDDLSYLRKGGRISAAKSYFGNLLNFKVVIKTGNNLIAPTDTVRGMPNALRCIVLTALKEDIDYSLPSYIGFTYDQERAERLLEITEKESPLRPARMVSIGATVGAHVGPGSTGLCWFVK